MSVITYPLSFIHIGKNTKNNYIIVDMSREEIIEKLTPIARQVFANEALEITDNLSAANVPTWTSLAFMQFLTEIENQFGFKFKMMELFNLKSMGNILASIEKHMA